MKDKKSFVLYSDLISTVEQLPDDKAGQLFKHILSYVNDENPETDDFIVKIVFEPIKQQLMRDLDKWKDNLDRKSEAGRLGNLKRWHLDLFEKLSNGDISLEEAEQIARNRKASRTDRTESQDIANIAVNVNDSVTVNVNDILLKKETKKFDFKGSLLNYGFNEKLIDEWLQVRKKKKAVNTETAFNGFISQLEKTGQPKTYVLRTCVERSWGAFKSSWLEKEERKGSGQKKDSISTLLDIREELQNENKLKFMNDGQSTE